MRARYFQVRNAGVDIEDRTKPGTMVALHNFPQFSDAETQMLPEKDDSNQRQFEHVNKEKNLRLSTTI
jgi:hypothetical protein